jgi:hypothetical protein
MDGIESKPAEEKKIEKKRKKKKSAYSVKIHQEPLKALSLEDIEEETEMDMLGTPRYVQNIPAIIAAIEKYEEDEKNRLFAEELQRAREAVKRELKEAEDSKPPTPAPVVEHPSWIAREFILHFVYAFRSEKSINEIIKKRHILTNWNLHNDRTDLAELANEFDDEGNRSQYATFQYVNEDRFNAQVRLHLRPRFISDREKIALIAIFFNTAEILADYPLQNSILEALQLIIARRIRHVAGFDTPHGYAPRKHMLEVLNDSLNDVAMIYEEALVSATFKLKLQEKVSRLSAYSNRLRPAGKPLEKMSEHKLQKYGYISDILDAINHFSKTQSYMDFFGTISHVKSLNQKRLKLLPCKSRVTAIINEMYLLAIEHEAKFFGKNICATTLSLFYHKKYSSNEIVLTPNQKLRHKYR